jgi:hypothetical protein
MKKPTLKEQAERAQLKLNDRRRSFGRGPWSMKKADFKKALRSEKGKG